MPRRRREVERRLVRRIELTYLQSIQVQEGDRPPEDFFEVGTDFSPLEQAFTFRGRRGRRARRRRRRRRKRLQDVMGTKFPYTDAGTGRRTSDTGWVLTDSYEEVDWDKVAYRIGVREVGLNSFLYAPVSSRVSIPFTSPKPIWKIVVKAKEDIPPSYSPTRAWIHYHVSIDDGNTWHRINPLDKPTRFDEKGNVVPRIITINAEIASNNPEEMDIQTPLSVKSVRIKYTLFADQDVDEPNKTSPVLTGVQVLLYPRGGLSGSEPEQQVT